MHNFIVVTTRIIAAVGIKDIFFHHTTCESACDTLASADEARVSHVLSQVV